MSGVGILAYGSLITDPGKEIGPVVCDRKYGVRTPFPIEFARSSSTRDGAPTLVPVEDGGSCVDAIILVLGKSTSKEVAEDLLWRRETRKEDSLEHYSHPLTSSPNKVVVESLYGLAGLDVVLYTKLGSNIADLSSSKLARLAIESARKKSGGIKKDGISYLIAVKQQGISTPLMAEYESKILQITGTCDLEAALNFCRS